MLRNGGMRYRFSALRVRELLEFQEQIQESNVPILVQVMDWNKMPESFHSNILKKYEVIYSTKIL